MRVTGLRLYKKEKLCSETAIATLFSPESTDTRRALAFPLRAVWRVNGRRTADCPQFLVMVPKRRVRHAVDRVTLRRRIREAYRLSRSLIPADERIDIAFVYVANDIRPYSDIARAMTRLLTKIGAQ